MGTKKNTKAKKADGGTKGDRAQEAQVPEPAGADTEAKRMSALGAAARVLAEEGRPMSCKELVGIMAGKGYWSSPAGKTPAATLYAPMTREIGAKGGHARVRESGRGPVPPNAQA